VRASGEAIEDGSEKIDMKEGDIILDPFAGSGTTCVVAKKLGRNYIGIEINPEYVEMAKKRLERAVRGLGLYG
jgi:DNA modification methylase